jgi:hypothetical protein
MSGPGAAGKGMGRRWTRAGIAMSCVWLATVVGALAMVRVLVETVSTLGVDGGLLAILAMLALVAIAYVSMGALIYHQRPGNRIAWVLAAGGLLIVLAFSGFTVGATRYLQFGVEDAIGGWFALLGATTLGPALYVAVPLVAILFPDGHLPGPRWRLPVVVVTGFMAASALIGLIQPGPVESELGVNPLGVDSPAVASLRELGLALLPIGLLASAILAVASIAVRFRRGSATERAQLKWLLAAVALCAVLLPPSFIDDNGPSGFSLLDTLAMASLALVPLSVGVAVTRYRLYEIDRLISRTIGWAVVTVVLAGVFVGLVVLLQAILAPVTRENTLAVAASTLVALGLFGPLRRAVQRAVDRQFDRARYDAQTTTAQFLDRVRNEVDLGTLRAELVATATDAVRPTDAGLWLRATSAER